MPLFGQDSEVVRQEVRRRRGGGGPGNDIRPDLNLCPPWASSPIVVGATGCATVPPDYFVIDRVWWVQLLKIPMLFPHRAYHHHSVGLVVSDTRQHRDLRKVGVYSESATARGQGKTQTQNRMKSSEVVMGLNENTQKIIVQKLQLSEV